MTHDELCSGLNSVALSAALEDNALLRADIARLLARQQELLQTLAELYAAPTDGDVEYEPHDFTGDD